MPVRKVTDPSILQQLNADNGMVAPNPMFPDQLSGQKLNNTGQALTNQEKGATVPFAGPTAAANLTGQTLQNARTAQDLGLDRVKVKLQLQQQFAADPAVRLYRTALPEMAKAMRAGQGKQGDIDVVYSFAKVMDPGSAVREGEIQFANASASLIQRVHQYVDMVDKGKGLAPAVRRGLIEEMAHAAAEYNRGYSQVFGQYRSMAKEAGFDPDQVVGKHAGETYRKTQEEYNRRTYGSDQQPGQTSFVGGKTHAVNDKGSSRLLDSMIRQGVPYEQAMAVMSEASPGALPEGGAAAYNKAVAYAQNHKDHKGSFGLVMKDVPTSTAQKIANFVDDNFGTTGQPGSFTRGGVEAWDRAANMAETGLNAIPGIDVGQSAHEASAQHQDFFQQNPLAQDTGAQTAGRLVGAGTLTAPLRGPMLAGGVSNLLMTDSSGGEGIKDAAVGAAGGKAADWLLRGGAQLIAPEGREAMTRLHGQGVRFSPGQMIGGRARALEDRLTANPVLGPRIGQIRDEGIEGANRILPNRALGHIGQQLPDDVAAGHEAVAHTHQAFNDEYGNILNGQNINLDPTYITRLNAIGARLNMRPQDITTLGDLVQREVGGAFQSGRTLGSMSGRTYKALDERLGDLASTFGRNDDPFQRDIGNALGQVRQQTRALARRQNPEMGQALRNADEGYANYSILRRAAASNPATGLFGAGQLRTAVRQGDRSVGKGATARGKAVAQDLASDMSETLPSTVGSSGTSEREQVNKIAPWVIGSLLSPLYSDPAERLLANTLLRTPGPAAQRIANGVRALPRSLGGLGFPLLLQSQ